jgi:soluble lytic murein transglycosylase-like protein
LSFRSVVRQVALGVGAAAALFVSATYVHRVEPRPIRVAAVDSVPVMTWQDSVSQLAPWADTTDAGMAQFEADRRAFAADLVRTGNVDVARADSVALYAVTEAYRRHVPPALVFGVLMTENGDLVSRARSKVGAVGLMQVYPKAWVRSLGHRFGTDLRDDETNLRYGVFILSHYLKRNDARPSTDSTLRMGLLRYNGCVRGANTPNCKSYPDVVRSRIERLAVSQCGGRGFSSCVAKPMKLAMRDAE